MPRRDLRAGTYQNGIYSIVDSTSTVAASPVVVS
jgi:hypothetical protein